MTTNLKALIPAAGLGIRWHPWSKVIPKELLPITNHPAIHYVLDDAVAAGIREIGIIISRTKQLIRSYVDGVWRVHRPEIKIQWFYQPSPRGVGDALLCAKDWVNDKATAVLYPDIIHPKEGGMSQICRLFQKLPGCWIGVTSKKPKRRHMCLAMEKTGRGAFCIYGPYSEGSTLRLGYGTGRYILPYGFSHMHGSISQSEKQSGKEFDDDRIFAPLWNQDVRGIILSEPIYDVGRPQNWCVAISKLCE